MNYISRGFVCSHCGDRVRDEAATNVGGKIMCDSCMVLFGARLTEDDTWQINQQFRFSFREAFGIELPLIETREG